MEITVPTRAEQLAKSIKLANLFKPGETEVRTWETATVHGKPKMDCSIQCIDYKTAPGKQAEPWRVRMSKHSGYPSKAFAEFYDACDYLVAHHKPAAPRGTHKKELVYLPEWGFCATSCSKLACTRRNIPLEEFLPERGGDVLGLEVAFFNLKHLKEGHTLVPTPSLDKRWADTTYEEDVAEMQKRRVSACKHCRDIDARCRAGKRLREE